MKTLIASLILTLACVIPCAAQCPGGVCHPQPLPASVYAQPRPAVWQVIRPSAPAQPCPGGVCRPR